MKSLFALLAIASVSFVGEEPAPIRIFWGVRRTEEGAVLTAEPTRDALYSGANGIDASLPMNRRTSLKIPYSYFESGEFSFVVESRGWSMSYRLDLATRFEGTEKIQRDVLWDGSGKTILSETFEPILKERYCWDYRDYLFRYDYRLGGERIEEVSLSCTLSFAGKEGDIDGALYEKSERAFLVEGEEFLERTYALKDGVRFRDPEKEVPCRVRLQGQGFSYAGEMTFRPFHLLGEKGPFQLYER